MVGKAGFKSFNHWKNSCSANATCPAVALVKEETLCRNAVAKEKPGCSCEQPGFGFTNPPGRLNFSDEVETRGEGVIAGLPAGWADLVAEFADEFGGFEFAQGFDSAASDAEVVHF